MDLGPHGVFILTAHAATGLILAGLILRAIVDQRTQRRALAELEALGLRQRPDDPAPFATDGGGKADLLGQRAAPASPRSDFA
jgi:heme exporter protein D